MFNVFTNKFSRKLKLNLARNDTGKSNKLYTTNTLREFPSGKRKNNVTNATLKTSAPKAPFIKVK